MSRWIGNAVLSMDEQFRYLLGRHKGDRDVPSLLYVMLNPSTADALVDDNTIRRCEGFAERFGYEQFYVVNLFAHRATKPSALLEAIEPIGAENDGHIIAAAHNAGMIICAWGSEQLPMRKYRAMRVKEILQQQAPVIHRLGPPNKDGSPKHPLYLPNDIKLEEHE